MSGGRILVLAIVAWLLAYHGHAMVQHARTVVSTGPRVHALLRLDQYATALAVELHRQEKEELPRSLPRDLASWLDEHFESRNGKPAHLDPFGVSYQTYQADDVYWLRSCGPDRVCASADDLTKVIASVDGKNP